jgi:deoxycytidylate deaminase
MSHVPQLPAVRLADLDGGIDQPELFFGVVAAVGTPWSTVEPYLRGGLASRGYMVDPLIKVSELLRLFKLKVPYPPTTADEYERVTTLMDMGDELRRVTGRSESLALMVAAHINAKRPPGEDRNLPGRAFLIHQLKHPDEVLWLRHIYGDAFHLIGLYSLPRARKEYLKRTFAMSDDRAESLIKRDEAEAEPWGQQLRDTFHLADVFIEIRDDASSTAHAYQQIERFLDLLFGRKIITPTRHEYAMYLAQAAALRSADLSRQVGAAILDDNGEILALGTNEVPAAGGGQYWGEEGKPDHRDFREGCDSNEVKKRESIEEILSNYDPKRWSEYTPEQKKEFIEKLGSTRVGNLIEFGRAVHAEMEAMLSAARRAVSVKGTTLYTTTFPCHNCAKHIVGAGIKKVIYIEPYPKSLAGELHKDSIGFPGEPPLEDQGAATATMLQSKVWFEPFVGVAPRRYSALFSSMSEQGQRLKRKVKGGAVSTEPVGLRLRASVLSHVQREALAAVAAQGLQKPANEELSR